MSVFLGSDEFVGGTLLTDYGFWMFIIDVVLSSVAIIVAVVFGWIAHIWLTAIAASQVSEKTAMIHGYVGTIDEWRVRGSDYVAIITRRIEADILALRHMANRSDRELQDSLREAFDLLVSDMRIKAYISEANRLQAAFDSLWR